MSFETTQIEACHGRLRYLPLLCMLFLFPIKALAEEDTLQATKSAQLDDDPTEISNKASSLLGDHANAFNRNVVLYETLTRVNKDELVELLEDSLDIALGSIRHETLFAIASRFALIDPHEAIVKSNELSEHERDPFLKGIFSEWCVTDLDAAVAAALMLNRHERLSTLMAIVKVRDDLTASNLNAIASILGHPNYSLNSESQTKTIKFADDPIAAWSVLVHDGLDDMSQLDTLVLVAEAAIEKQGLDALFHLHEPFADKIRIVGEPHFFDAVLDAIVKTDTENTWAYIQNGSPPTLERSLKKLQSPNHNTVSSRDKAYMTDHVQYLLMQSWADAFPDTVLTRIEQIPRKLQPLACKRALAALITTEPERTVELIRLLSPYGAGSDVSLAHIARQWSATDPSATLDWILSSLELEHVSNKSYIMRIALESLVLEDPKRALQVAALQDNSMYLEGWVMGDLALSDFETAIEVLPLVSESSKENATSWVAGALAQLGEVDRGMELLRQYEETLEEDADWYWFFMSWARFNAVQLFERLDELDPKLRHSAAAALDYLFIPGFTQEQLDYIHYVSDNLKLSHVSGHTR